MRKQFIISEAYTSIGYNIKHPLPDIVLLPLTPSALTCQDMDNGPLSVF